MPSGNAGMQEAVTECEDGQPETWHMYQYTYPVSVLGVFSSKQNK